MKTFSGPSFFVDSLPDISNTDCRERIRSIDIEAGAPDIFLWLKQLRIAPYSYDFVDNRGRKSPDFIIENLPPLKVKTHYLLSFHIIEFRENYFIACRLCEPINKPLSFYIKDLFIEYRIEEEGTKAKLWCKLKGYYYRDIFSKGFFFIFSVLNKIMMTRQLKNIKRLSELLNARKVVTRIYDLKSNHHESGIHWWFFCRHRNCKGIVT